MSSSDDPYTLNSTQKALRSVIIASISITGAFIATRCWIRARLQIQFSVDDYLLVTAFVRLSSASI
ncbi:putative integral membrane family protein [Lasiodiplodia theobromae]|nr:putative integral membrane family protein [Lasiodiplodia theobromae]